MLQVMNAQQCVDSQLIVEAPALMSIVRPYSISLRTTARWPSEVSQADRYLTETEQSSMQGGDQPDRRRMAFLGSQALLSLIHI